MLVRRITHSINSMVQPMAKAGLFLPLLSSTLLTNPDISLSGLLAFPEQLQGERWGVISTHKNAQEILERTGYKRHFLKQPDLIQLSDGNTIAVSKEWGSGNIGDFIGHAQSLGHAVK